MKYIIVLTMALFASISIFGQSPQSFNYQGVARDNAGNELANPSNWTPIKCACWQL